MRVLRSSLFGLVPLLAAALWIRSTLLNDRERFVAFCQTTRRGEPWPEVQARAAARGYAFARANASTEKTEEYLFVLETMGYRDGCRVEVLQGRVEGAKEGELPYR